MIFKKGLFYVDKLHPKGLFYVGILFKIM